MGRDLSNSQADSASSIPDICWLLAATGTYSEGWHRPSCPRRPIRPTRWSCCLLPLRRGAVPSRGPRTTARDV